MLLVPDLIRVGHVNHLQVLVRLIHVGHVSALFVELVDDASFSLGIGDFQVQLNVSQVIFQIDQFPVLRILSWLGHQLKHSLFVGGLDVEVLLLAVEIGFIYLDRILSILHFQIDRAFLLLEHLN